MIYVVILLTLITGYLIAENKHQKKTIYDLKVNIAESKGNPLPEEPKGIVGTIENKLKEIKQMKENKKLQTYQKVQSLGKITQKEKNLLGVERSLY